MDPEYNPSHKTSSITSTTSTNSWDTVPSLTTSSVCDDESSSMNEQPMTDDFAVAGDRVGLGIPSTDLQAIQKIDDATGNIKTSLSHCLDDSYHIPSGQVDRPNFLHPSHEITICHSTTTKKEPTQESLLASRIKAEPEQQSTDTSIINSNSSKCDIGDEIGGLTGAQIKPSRDPLTEDEKRANHIASEQKRRATIREGFKEMTEIIPALKNVNKSKSTILFKAVEYIRQLDKCNRGLRDKIHSLRTRLEIQGRINGLTRIQPRLLRRSYNHYHNERPVLGNSSNRQQQLPPETLTALLLHRNQQKQLEILQEQLRYQQELLTRHNITATDVESSRDNHDLSTDDQSSLLSPSYSSISIPLDRSPLSSTPVLSCPPISQQSSPIYKQFFSSPLSPSFVRHHQHRSTAPALVMPNTTEIHPFISSTDGALAGISSVNIPVDNDFSDNLTASSK